MGTSYCLVYIPICRNTGRFYKRIWLFATQPFLKLSLHVAFFVGIYTLRISIEFLLLFSGVLPLECIIAREISPYLQNVVGGSNKWKRRCYPTRANSQVWIYPRWCDAINLATFISTINDDCPSQLITDDDFLPAISLEVVHATLYRYRTTWNPCIIRGC